MTLTLQTWFEEGPVCHLAELEQICQKNVRDGGLGRATITTDPKATQTIQEQGSEIHVFISQEMLFLLMYT